MSDTIHENRKEINLSEGQENQNTSFPQDEVIGHLQDQETFHSSQASRKKFDPRASSRHMLSASLSRAAADLILEKDQKIALLESQMSELNSDSLSSSQNHDNDLFTLCASEISDMPESLKNTLNINESDELDGQIIELLQIANRPLSIKELIVGLYKKYDVETPERNPFASKLYRMTKQGLLKSTEGKRGYYELP